MTSTGKKLTKTSSWWFLIVVPMLVVAPLVASAEDASCSACSCNGDRDGDGVVTIDEAVAAVNNILEGCPPLLWQRGCGPPIHGGMDNCPDTVDVCTSQRVGELCDEANAKCCLPGSKCLGERCNAPLVCASRPHAHCPISRRDYKRDIEYLGRGDVEDLRRHLLAFKLARYRYKGDAQSAPARLGFIIEDIEPSPAVDEPGDAVDLYGYLSLAVATLQAQSNDIDALKREVDDLRHRLNGLKATSAKQPMRPIKSSRVAPQEHTAQR